MEFCECGSIIVKGNCSNRKCKYHEKSAEDYAAPKQKLYIKELAERLGEDISDIDLDYLSKSEAAALIEDYLERLEENGEEQD